VDQFWIDDGWMVAGHQGVIALRRRIVILPQQGDKKLMTVHDVMI